MAQLEIFNQSDRFLDEFGFSLHGPRPIWLPSILANPNEPRGIAAVSAVLRSQFQDVDEVPLGRQEFINWLQEQSISAILEVPTSWKDDYDRLEWEAVGEFFLRHLFDGSGPFEELGYASEDLFLARGRSGSVYTVVPRKEESLVVKIVHSNDVTKTDWLQEGVRIGKAQNLNSENLARPQTPDPQHPGFFVFFAIHGNTLGQRWADDIFHEPRSLAKKAFQFSSQVHQLSDR